MSDSKKLQRAMAAGVVTGAFGLVSAVAAAADDALALTEVVVTAQKRSENLQDVPSSVSVLGGEKLAQLHATSLADYGAYMPGFNVASGGTPGQTTITLRGIAPVGPGAVVGTYLNDTPLGSSSNYARSIEFALDLMPYDIERVEVLRGPQGTLYGSSTMGGLLKYVVKDPDLEQFELLAGVEGFSIANADDLGWGVRAAVNAPISDTMAFRASFFDQDTPGYVDNALTGEEGENAVEQYGGRASLLWQPLDVLSIKLSGMWQRIRSDDKAWMSLSVTGVDPPTGAATFGDLTTSHPLAQSFDKDVDFYSATVNLDTGWGDFVSASSYSSADTIQHTDASLTYGSLYPLFGLPVGLNDFTISLGLEKWTQEFRLASKSEGKVEWLIGAFYTKETSTNDQVSVATDNDGVLIPIFAPLFAFASLPTDYREIAGFGDLTFKLTDRFDITAGLRWAQNEQKFRQISGGVVVPVADIPGSSKEDVWTYAVSPRLHVTDDTMVYARVASGYRPGGPNVFLPGVPPQVNADKLTNYEAGIKTEFLDRRALVNFDVFYIDWEGIQQIQAFGGVSGLTNAGDATSRGMELETSFLARNGLQLGFNLAYTDAQLESNPPGSENNPPEFTNTLGVQLPLVPEWSGAVTLDYNFTMAQHPARIGGGYRYVDKRGTTVVTDAADLSFVMPSYQVLDLNADVSFEKMTLRVYAKNVTDERAFLGGGPTVSGLDNSPLQLDMVVLQPRTLGVSVDFKF